jgi:Cd2+/Zn2+-exporting ATPase
MKIVDQYMGFYTPLVLVIAALVWAFTKNLNNVISVIIFSCPCAFILATPTAMVAALSAAARLGILIKNVADLEMAAKINAFIFDKTGTLTTGELAVSRLAPLNGVTPADLLLAAASAEKYSNHPTAKALARLAGEAGVGLVEPKDFSEAAGRGVKAEIKGAKVLVGRAQWLRDNNITEDFMKSVDLNEAEGWSLIFVAREGKCIGWIGLQDQTRAEAKAALSELKESGVRRVAMISGDRQPVVNRVAAAIGCEEAKGDCLPQNKVEYVRAVKAKGYKVAVVGDGVNDAPALAAGEIGIAMGAAGSEVAIHSATIALMNNDLRRLPFLVNLSRSTRGVINQNFLFGVLFIVTGMTFAALGKVHPMLAAALHTAGSLIVVFNSARLVRKGEEMEHYQAENAPRDSSPAAPSAPTGLPQVAPKMA